MFTDKELRDSQLLWYFTTAIGVETIIKDLTKKKTFLDYKKSQILK